MKAARRKYGRASARSRATERVTTWLRPKSTTTPTIAVSVSARYRRPNSISPSVRETTIRKTMAIRLDTTWEPASTDQLRTIVISGATALGRLVQPDPDESKPGQRCGQADRERDHVVGTERRAELSGRQPVAGGLQVPDLTGPDCVVSRARHRALAPANSREPTFDLSTRFDRQPSSRALVNGWGLELIDPVPETGAVTIAGNRADRFGIHAQAG